jgi:ferric-dicitrate binding protein FerR (iron transport regulator)
MAIDNDQIGDSNSLDKVLEHAERRQPAPEIIRARAFSRLHDHWRKTTRRQRVLRVAGPWAMAAGVLLSIAFVLNLGDIGPQVAPISVASVNRVTGETAIQLTTSAGQTAIQPNIELSTLAELVTGDDSRIALTWNEGGTLRLDTNTSVALVSPTEIRLNRGAIYYDSYDYESQSNARADAITITTPFGEISHVGTQFSVRMQENSLLLRVREGTAKVTGDFETSLISEEREGLFDSQGKTLEQHVNPYGESWRWAEEIAPLYSASGKSPKEVLAWIGRETGRKLVYASPESLALAQSQKISGLENVSPEQALTAIPYATQLAYTESAGSIEIHIVD